MKLRIPNVWLPGLVFAWLLFFAVQALQRPFDGFLAEHVNAPGAAWLAGSLLAQGLTALLPPEEIMPVLRDVYLFLLLAVPIFSIVVIARHLRQGEGRLDESRRDWLLLASIALLALVAFGCLTYFSNDIYLFRVQGRMLSVAGVNPYAASPAQVLPSAQLQNIPWTLQKCAYGPLALLGFEAVTVGNHGVVADFWLLKLLLAIPFVFVLLLLARHPRLDRRARWVGFAWIGLNPLLLLEIFQNVHLEGWLGLLLILLLLALDRVSTGRVAAAGGLFGLACAIKLSLLALAPIIVVWLWMADEERAWQVALGRIALLALVCVATLAALYWPFWIGGATFDGLQREAGKIIRSLHALLGAWFGLSPGCLRACGLAGNLLAAAAGAWICWRRKSLAQGLLVGLLAQVVLGRTFLQPWHFCPALLLVPFLGFAARPPASGGLRWAELRSLLVLSVSALAGGYVALLWVPGSRADLLQTISFLCIVLPPAIWWGIEIWNLKSRIWNRKDSIY